MNNHTPLTVNTPGKLILSGEHAVVYGHPALATAINRVMQVTIRWSTPLHFSFHLGGLDFRKKVTLEALKRLKRKLNKQYEQFDQGHISIREVLKHPIELTLYSAIKVLEKLKHKLPMGIDISSESEIPMGCGLGSSAASVVSIIYALGQFLNIEFSLDDYIRLGIESENLQHGYSSGLDVHVVYHGGLWRYQPGQWQALPTTHRTLTLINTGQPASTTGECVSHAKAMFANSTIGKDFAAITQQIETAFIANNLKSLQQAVQHNHALLCQINVVPKKVQEFIAGVQQLGLAAKICGAGSVNGDHAGMVWIVGDHEQLHSLVTTYGYEMLEVETDSRGTHVV